MFLDLLLSVWGSSSVKAARIAPLRLLRLCSSPLSLQLDKSGFWNRGPNLELQVCHINKKFGNMVLLDVGQFELEV